MAEVPAHLGLGLRTCASPFFRGAIACSGTEFCKLAITETKGFARWLVEELEERLPGFDQQLKLNVTGCPNSCGQHWIADIGLEGKKSKHEGRLQDAYYFCLGGAVGREQAIARAVGYRCLAVDVPSAIERLLQRYLDLRFPGENLPSSSPATAPMRFALIWQAIRRLRLSPEICQRERFLTGWKDEPLVSRIP